MNIKKLVKYKFIVSSGCSYGYLGSVLFTPFIYFKNPDLLKKNYKDEWLDTSGDNIVSINVSLPSHGSDWQSDSIINVISTLMYYGVEPDNIYCLVEWSQWDRSSFHLSHVHDINFDNFKFINILHNDKKINISGDMLSEDLEFIKNIFNIKVYSQIGEIENRYYINPQHMDLQNFVTSDYNQKFFFNYIKEVQNNLPLENLLKNYLDNILRTQYFLKSKNIKYNFCFMQSTLSEWSKKPSGVLVHSHYNGGMSYYYYDNIKEEIIKNPEYKPKNDISSDVEIIMKETTHQINQMDFTNFWFYENEKYRRGGLDEWAIDNLQDCGYFKFGKTSENILHNYPNYGQHPNFITYILLWNKVTSNCDFIKVKAKFEYYLLMKYWEDFFYEDETMNGITISYKELQKRIDKLGKKE